MRAAFVLVALWLAAAPALAEVKQSAPASFEIEKTVTVPVSPSDAYAALASIGSWWDPQHSYSGDAANFSLDPKAGGCFCEAIPADGGSVEHGRVVYARPGDTMRMQAALGPLQSEAVTGILTWTLKPAAGGTEIRQHYLVSGYMKQGGAFYAPLVDKVMTIQLDRLAALLRK